MSSKITETADLPEYAIENNDDGSITPKDYRSYVAIVSVVD